MPLAFSIYTGFDTISLITTLLLSLLVVTVLGQTPPVPTAGTGSNTTQPTSAPSNATHSIRSSPPADDKAALEFAYRQVELETQRLDKLVSNAETVGTLMTALVVAFAAVLALLGVRSIKEIKDEMRASVQTTVDKILQDKSKSAETVEQLVESLGPAQTRWAEIEQSLDNLARFEELSRSQFGDAQGAYGLARELADRGNTSPDDRRAALGCLLKIIELGEQGKVDPNILFNACTVASEMDFDHEALKLSTLCAHWDPKPSHSLRKSRLEDVFGMRFELKESSLVLSEQPPITVRHEAWKAAREMVRQGPTFQCELIFSELHNIALRNRESGYIDDAIVVLEDLTKGERVPSYAFAILSGFYAMRGNETWLDDYLTAVTKAIEILRVESPACTWYEHTTRDVRRMAEQTGRTAEITEIIDHAGLQTAKEARDNHEE
ncbi:MAG: hypothetical protein GXY55_12180 [Phycisphaerae bacterium]|nr:hypothetical protein [Phycisphaerae bacterium]